MNSDTSPYAPPQTELRSELDHGERRFFVVAPLKLVILSLLSMGDYLVWWHYQNWKLYRAATGADIWVLPRAVLQIFFYVSLCQKLDDWAKFKGVHLAWVPTTHGIILIVVGVVSTGLGLIRTHEDLVGILMLATGVVFYIYLVKIQRFINLLAGDPDGSTNASFVTIHWPGLLVSLLPFLTAIAAVIGIVVLILAGITQG